MHDKKRGQISVEYLIIAGFVTFLVVGMLGIAMLYSSHLRDRIQMNELGNFANKITHSAETVYYAGEPSKVTLSVYLPTGVQNITIAENTIFITVSTSSGINRLSFPSNVALQGQLSTTEGVHKVALEAQTDYVTITQVS